MSSSIVKIKVPIVPIKKDIPSRVLKVFPYTRRINKPCKIYTGYWDDSSKAWIYPSGINQTTKEWTNVSTLLKRLPGDYGRASILVVSNGGAVNIDIDKGTGGYVELVGEVTLVLSESVSFNGQNNKDLSVGGLVAGVSIVNSSNFYNEAYKSIDLPYWDPKTSKFVAADGAYGTLYVTYEITGDVYDIYYGTGEGLLGDSFLAVQDEWAYSKKDIDGPGILVKVTSGGVTEELTLPRHYSPGFLGDKLGEATVEKTSDKQKFVYYKVWIGKDEAEIAEKKYYMTSKFLIERRVSNSKTGEVMIEKFDWLWIDEDQLIEIKEE